MSSAGPSRQSGRKPAPLRRAEIMTAAAVSFAETGFAGTSVEAIAAGVDVSHPRIIQMFGSKRALFLDVVAAAYDRITAEFHAVALKYPEGAVPLIALGQAYRDLLSSDRTVALVILQGYAAAGDSSMRGAVAAHHIALTKTIIALSGADALDVRTFFATGLIITVSTALDLNDARNDEAWAATLLNGKVQPRN